MCWYPSDAGSETYELKIATFENGQPEELFVLMKNFKTAIDRTGTMLESVKISYLRNLLRGEALQEFYGLSIQNTGTKQLHLKFIQEVLYGVFYYRPFQAEVRDASCNA